MADKVWITATPREAEILLAALSYAMANRDDLNAAINGNIQEAEITYLHDRLVLSELEHFEDAE